MLDLSPEPDQVAIRFISECAARLAAGVCLLIHESKIRKVSEKKNPSTRWRLSKLPLTAEYVVGADIVVRLDCREAIREYVSGERRKKPVCQWIVRGHWRNQACGPSLTERKRTWIEPYWKGPEREPILSREHVLVNAVPKG